MGKKPQKEKNLWDHLIPVNIFCLALGIFAYFVRLHFNISFFYRGGTKEDIAFSWEGLILHYILPCLAIANLFGWFGYLKEKA